MYIPTTFISVINISLNLILYVHNVYLLRVSIPITYVCITAIIYHILNKRRIIIIIIIIGIACFTTKTARNKVKRKNNDKI